VLISLVVKFIGNLLQKIDWKIYIAIISVFIIVILIGLQFVINSSAPAELSLLNSEENKTVTISKDVKLKPNKSYILRFKAEAKMKDGEKPYAFSVRLFNKNINNILFSGSEQLVRQDFSATNGVDEFDLLFITKEDTKLVNVSFLIYYSGTSVIIDNASVIDAETGEVIKIIILKNKYNLDKMISRFQNIWLQQSLVSRAIFYKDGFNIFKDRWFLGAGGGAWNYLYRQYQSYNYASSQAHNYPLQLAIETGILGLITLINLVIILIITYIKYYKKVTSNYISASVMVAIVALFMHSVIDFDFSESSMLLLFWQFIALFNRELIESPVINDVSLLKLKMNAKQYGASKERKSSMAIGIIMTIIAIYFSSTFTIASSYAKQAYENLKNNDLETAIIKMEKAIMVDRHNEKYVIGYNPIQNRPDIKAGLTDILFIKNVNLRNAQGKGEKISETELNLFHKQLSKANLYIRDIEKKAINNLSLTSDLASYYFKIGEIDKGIAYINLAISYFPFEPSLWHSKIDLYYQLMGNYLNNGEYKMAEEYLLNGLNVINEAKEINEKNMNPFVFNLGSVEILQKMKFLKDNWDTEKIYDVNNVIHYSIFDLDVNMDGTPEQWGIDNTELINGSIKGNEYSIQAYGRSYLYVRYPMKLIKGSAYKIEIKLKDAINYISFYIPGITPEAIPLVQEGNKYIAELIVESEPNENGNQFRIYVEDNCVIESVLVMEKQNKY